MKRAIRHTERGFGIYGDIIDGYGGSITIYESSAAIDWQLWVNIDGETVHLNQEEVLQVRDALNNWLEDVKGASSD